MRRAKQCPYCGVPMNAAGVLENRPTREHAIPRSRGGKGRKPILACRRCNQIKGDMMPDEFAEFCSSFPGWKMMSRNDVVAALKLRDATQPTGHKGDE